MTASPSGSVRRLSVRRPTLQKHASLKKIRRASGIDVLSEIGHKPMMTWREKLLEVLRLPRMSLAVLVLVFLDFICVIGKLLIYLSEADICEVECKGAVSIPINSDSLVVANNTFCVGRSYDHLAHCHVHCHKSGHDVAHTCALLAPLSPPRRSPRLCRFRAAQAHDDCTHLMLHCGLTDCGAPVHATQPARHVPPDPVPAGGEHWVAGRPLTAIAYSNSLAGLYGWRAAAR